MPIPGNACRIDSIVNRRRFLKGAGVAVVCLAVSAACRLLGVVPDVSCQEPQLTPRAYFPLVMKRYLPPRVGDIYYVAPNGDDSNGGTKSQPWRTIQYAVDHVTAGDTVVVRGGTYHESVQFSTSGEEGGPITLTNYDGEAVTISGGASPAIEDTSGTEHWIIEGLTLDSSAQHTIRFDAWGCDGTCRGTHHWTIRNNTIIGSVRIYGSYNVLESNEVDGSQHHGTQDENGVWELHDASHHNVFRSNHIHHFNMRGIWSMHRTHDSVFEGNTIHDIQGAESGVGIDTDGFGTVEWRHTIRGNHISNIGLFGIELENTFDSIVENNVIHDTGKTGIQVINYGRTIPSPGEEKCEAGGESSQYGDTDGDNDCEGDITENIVRQNLIYGARAYAGIGIFHAGGVKVWGNTIYDVDAPGIYLDSGVEFCPEIEIRGNIVANSNHWAEIAVYDADSLVADDHNLLNHTGSGEVYAINWTPYSLSQYQAITGKGEGSIQADPRFVNPWGDDFHLQSNSPAIDAGVDIGLTTDLDGNARPLGARYDIGAYEYGSSVTLGAWWRNGTAYLSWNKPLYPDLAGYRIHYASDTGGDADQGPSPIDVTDPDQLTFQLTGLTMYSLYEVWTEPYDGNSAPLTESNHVLILPTDIFRYLPLVLKG